MGEACAEQLTKLQNALDNGNRILADPNHTPEELKDAQDAVAQAQDALDLCKYQEIVGRK